MLRWVAALGMLVWAAAMLVEFGYSLAAEQVLARAARAGAIEATLPRATNRSVEQVIQKRLDEWGISRRDARIQLAHNGEPVPGAFLPEPGDRITITLSVPGHAVLPGWLRVAARWTGGRPITARAERELPGRTVVKMTPLKTR